MIIALQAYEQFQAVLILIQLVFLRKTIYFINFQKLAHIIINQNYFTNLSILNNIELLRVRIYTYNTNFEKYI